LKRIAFLVLLFTASALDRPCRAEDPAPKPEPAYELPATLIHRLPACPEDDAALKAAIEEIRRGLKSKSPSARAAAAVRTAEVGVWRSITPLVEDLKLLAVSDPSSEEVLKIVKPGEPARRILYRPVRSKALEALAQDKARLEIEAQLGGLAARARAEEVLRLIRAGKLVPQTGRFLAAAAVLVQGGEATMDVFERLDLESKDTPFGLVVLVLDRIPGERSTRLLDNICANSYYQIYDSYLVPAAAKKMVFGSYLEASRPRLVDFDFRERVYLIRGMAAAALAARGVEVTEKRPVVEPFSAYSKVFEDLESDDMWRRRAAATAIARLSAGRLRGFDPEKPAAEQPDELARCWRWYETNKDEGITDTYRKAYFPAADGE
jgi:hypothetical protein